VIRVMVVDDALFMRKTYQKMFERNGIALAGEAANGFEAIALYPDVRPDVVLMDITMPGMPGIDALKEIMRMDPAAKVIMVSAMGQERFVRESILSGAKAFIVKPMIESELVATINRVFGA